MMFEQLMLVELWKGDATSYARGAGIISVVVGLVLLRSRAKHWDPPAEIVGI